MMDGKLPLQLTEKGFEPREPQEPTKTEFFDVKGQVVLPKNMDPEMRYNYSEIAPDGYYEIAPEEEKREVEILGLYGETLGAHFTRESYPIIKIGKNIAGTRRAMIKDKDDRPFPDGRRRYMVPLDENKLAKKLTIFPPGTMMSLNDQVYSFSPDFPEPERSEMIAGFKNNDLLRATLFTPAEQLSSEKRKVKIKKIEEARQRTTIEDLGITILAIDGALEKRQAVKDYLDQWADKLIRRAITEHGKSRMDYAKTAGYVDCDGQYWFARMLLIAGGLEQNPPHEEAGWDLPMIKRNLFREVRWDHDTHTILETMPSRVVVRHDNGEETKFEATDLSFNDPQNSLLVSFTTPGVATPITIDMEHVAKIYFWKYNSTKDNWYKSNPR